MLFNEIAKLFKTLEKTGLETPSEAKISLADLSRKARIILKQRQAEERKERSALVQNTETEFFLKNKQNGLRTISLVKSPGSAKKYSADSASIGGEFSLPLDVPIPMKAALQAKRIDEYDYSGVDTVMLLSLR